MMPTATYSMLGVVKMRSRGIKPLITFALHPYTVHDQDIPRRLQAGGKGVITQLGGAAQMVAPVRIERSRDSLI